MMKKYLILFFIIGINSNGLFGATWKKSAVTPPPVSGTSGKELTSAMCPANYIFVPKNLAYSPVNFCVMKYEAKNDGFGTAVSTATGTPWANINRPTARSKCQALGAGYDMISNNQWQTIARNIAGVPSNWNTGVVASGQLNRGHSDSAPASNLVAVTDDNDPCNGTGQACTSASWNSQRRTHTLSSGGVIWDFAGNVWEWVTNDSTALVGADAAVGTMNAGDSKQAKYGALAGTICPAPGTSPHCGMGWGLFAGPAGAIMRGGSWMDDVETGVFASAFFNADIDIDAQLGFRCVYVP